MEVALPEAEHARELCRNGDRKSTRLNSSHGYISYAVFCLKKKKKIRSRHQQYPSLEGAKFPSINFYTQVGHINPAQSLYYDDRLHSTTTAQVGRPICGYPT